MRRKIRRFFLLLLAFLFIIESWIWDKAGEVVARIVDWIPLDWVKEKIAHAIQNLPPIITLVIFAIPAILLFPLKLIALWLLAEGHLFFGVTVIVFAQVVGFGILSFLFDVCKPKLMQLTWVKHSYEWLVKWRERAYEYVGHYMRLIRRRMAVAARKRGANNPAALGLKLRSRVRLKRTRL
jgi:hypothetical protein